MNRRRFLGGAGAWVALPMLECLAPRRARASTATVQPNLVVYYFPCGRDPSGWAATTMGTQYTMPTSLAALTPLRDKVLLITGLSDAPSQQVVAGQGDHARSTGTLLTQVPVTNPSTYSAGISIDQVVANTLVGKSRFPSLQWTSAEPGVCDLSSSCIYTQCISWADAHTPLAPIGDPATAYQQMFAGSDPNATAAQQAALQAGQKSILDYVLGEGKHFATTLGPGDRAKLDEYFTSVRALETSLFTPPGANCMPGTAPPGGLDYQSSVKAFGDLVVIALQCGLTHVITYMIEFDINYRTHPWVQATLGTHALTHTGTDEARQALLRVETWQAEQLASLAQKLNATTDANGAPLLDSTLLLGTPAMGLGAIHDHNNISPVLLGKAGGALKPGKAMAYGNRQTYANLMVSVAQAMGVKLDRFGLDGTAALPGLT